MSSPGFPRLVIADDHAAILAAATTILHPSFAIVAAERSGEAAVEAAMSLDPDVVVLDVAMPGIGGFGAAALLRERGSRARVVFLSSHPDDDTVTAALGAGAGGFVSKLRLAQDLVPAIHHALAGRTMVPSYRAVRAWARPQGQRHDVQFYTHDRQLVDIVVENFLEALSAGDSVVGTLQESHLGPIEAALARRYDVGALERDGRLQLTDARAALNASLIDGTPDTGAFTREFDPIVRAAAAAAPSGHVFAYGEVAPILWSEGRFEAMDQLERIADTYAASHPLSLLCGYRVGPETAAGDGLAAACSHHRAVVYAGS